MKYSPDGTAPDQGRYKHTLYKTAFYLTGREGGFLIGPWRFDFEKHSVSDYQEWLSAHPSARNLLLSEIGVLDPGDETALQIAREVIALLPSVLEHAGDTPVCQLIAEAEQYLTKKSGAHTASTPYDAELAAIILSGINLRPLDLQGRPDIAYLIGVNQPVLGPRFAGLSRIKSLRSAAGLGHLEASILMAHHMMSDGVLSAAIEYLLAAHLQGHE